MPTDVIEVPGLAVVAGDVLTLRGTGLAAAETWALLCQAAQALQDLFLSNGGVVGGSRAGPVVTPHTLELTPRGRVLLQLAPPETARAYLPPEYRPGRIYSDTDSEKMWMYSLGRALLDTTPRIAALTGTVSVSPSSALQSVLAAMTEPDPRRRASLMNLLDVISEYCRTRLQARPFTHIVMEMYREVVRSPQYAARKRATYYQLNVLCSTRNIIDPSNHEKIYGHHHPQRQQDHVQLPSFQHQLHVGQHLLDHLTVQQRQQQQQQQQDHAQFSINQFRSLQQQQNYAQNSQDHRHNHHHHYYTKGAHFRTQSRNSMSHPNLSSLCGSQQQHGEVITMNACRTQFQSQVDIQSGSRSIGPATTHHQRRIHHHSRTYSQPVYTLPQHTRSSGNLPTTTNATADSNPDKNIYNDPIYALPVKPFLSSQDVRVNGLMAKAIRRNDDIHDGSSSISRHPSNTGRSQPDVISQPNERLHEDIYERTPTRKMVLQRQHSNPQLPNRTQVDDDFKRLSQPSIATTEPRCVAQKEEQIIRQQNPVPSMRLRGIQGPPKPPRIITTLRRAALSDSECNSQTEPPAKPPRIMVKNGPRARRGKAVQRAPSRLYRTVGGPMRCFNKAQCVGPEFVVRANQPSKTLCVGQVKAGSSGRIVVIMLTGQRVEVTCDPQKVTAGDLFQAIVQAESLDENFTLGLAVLLAGDFAILPPDTKLNKVAPPGWLSSGKSKSLLGLPTSFMLYLRLRFFLPSLRGIRSWISKHLLYLQIRRCILEQQLVCPYSELINLTGLALQAEFGNYNVNEHGCGHYFLLEHYVPESLILSADRHQSQPCVDANTLRAQLHRAHRDRRGLDSNKAEEMFITHAQSLPDYGSHYYIATVDSKELEKLMAQQRKGKRTVSDNRDVVSSLDGAENAYRQKKSAEQKACPAYGNIGIPRLGSRENAPMIPYTDEHAKSARLYHDGMCNNKNNNNNTIINGINGNNNKNKTGKRKTESNVWLAIHAQGLKLLERGGEPRERTELAHFQWRDVQTLSYSKSCLVVYSKLNGKRCKFKLRMDHRKSYFAFKLTSLHHQFFLRLRSELTSLQGLAKDFGVPLTTETKPSPLKVKINDGKTKITIANTVKMQKKMNYPMQLEEYQNKENENPQKDNNVVATKDVGREPGFYSSEEDALYAQVNVRLEPEGQSRDTEEESERGLTTPNEILLEPKSSLLETKSKDDKLYGSPHIDSETETECTYSLPKTISNNINQLDKPNNPEELYAAINKVRLSGKSEFPVPDEVWNVSDVRKTLQKMKTSSLPNYGAPKQSGGFRTPSLPRRLGVKMGTRAIYSSLVQKDIALTDDTESLSLKSDTESSIQSISARSTESPMPEAYVLNADIRTDDETFRVPEDESMSASLMARLEELSFAEERVLHTIKLERGHGGSIGLQVMEGNGGIYVQAVSVGGSADMAGNVNKGDRIVAINGQNLLNLRYEDALKMLQSSSETVELVLSQPANRKNIELRDDQGPIENHYLHDIKFDVSSEAETSSIMNKWIVQKTTDVASVQNTSSAYSSAASSAMGNHNNANSLYMTDFVDNNALKSANNGKSTDPPVPPQRTKRKNKPAPIASSITRSDATEATNDDARSRQKRPLQPLLSEKCQWNKSRSAVENRDPQCDIAASYSKAENINERFRRENCNDDIATDMIETNSPQSRDDDTIFARKIPSRIDKANDDLVPAKSAALKPPLLPFPDIALPKRRTLDKYPPLFFTLHDFEDVMCAASPWNGDKSAPSATLEEKSSTAQILDDEDDISFRVTTTNLPFEKCLGRWRDSFDNDEFIEKLDYYRLDNNKNKSDRTKRLSSFDSSDNDYRTGTKVRFVIDSSPSKHYDNIKIDVPRDNLQSCESVFDDEKSSKQSIASFVKLSEIREECTDVKDCDDNLRDKLCASSAERRNTATREHDPFMITDTNKVDMKLKTIPQTHYDNINDEKIRKEDSNFISWNEHVNNENLRIGDENMMSTITEEIIMNDEYAVIDQSGMLDTSSEIADSVYCFTDKSLEAVCNNEKANSAKITQKSTHREEEISLNKTGDDIKDKYIIESEKTFVNESLLSFLNNRDDDKSSVLASNFTNGSFRIEDTRRLSTKEHKEKSDFVDSKYNREEASSSKEIFAKSVPVKIRRNSFLETMLTDNSIDTSINCAISTKTIVSSMSMNKELSIPNESANKIQELDITKKNEDVCNFYNKTTKVDTKNQEDSKKAKEKIVKVSSADIKSMQSENKNACDVKNDVLNELLCNFSNMKLKIVSPENKKSAMKIDGDKNIARSIAMDNGISKEKERASKSLEKSENEVCDISISAKITGINNNIAIDKKIAKENLTEINIEKRFQDLENSTYNLAIGEKIIKNKNNEVTKFNESCNIKNKTVNDRSIEKTIDENISNIRAEEICVKTRVEETSEGIKDADKVKQESKKLRDIRVPKTILKKNSVKCEQQQMSTFQKRIPIGAPAIMNKIFDSKEFEAITVASRSLENEREHEINSKQTHSHSKEKTDEVITVSEADDDQRRVANRSMLALLDDTMGSDDKCAIARKTTSIIPCNNNDNNKAVTPVVNISNDQSSRDIVTITPGKVRSFVKYYEIRGDATTVERHSKSKDKEKVIKRKSTKSQAPPVAARNSQPEVIMEGKETKCGSRSVKSNNILETSFNKNQFSTFATKVPEASADDSICKTAKEESKVTRGYEKSDSHVIDKETRAPLAKTGAKKSVQFLGGFTVIHSGTFDEDESAEIVTDNDANTLRKRQAPGIPPSRDSDGCQEHIREIKKSEKLPDAEKSSFQRREAVAQIHAVTSHGKNSGINCFVSKPKTPQLIIYCTI